MKMNSFFPSPLLSQQLTSEFNEMAIKVFKKEDLLLFLLGKSSTSSYCCLNADERKKAKIEDTDREANSSSTILLPHDRVAMSEPLKLSWIGEK